MRAFASFARWVSVCVVAAGLAGCASDETSFPSMPSQAEAPPAAGRSASLESQNKLLQCVPYARDHSDVKIYGDAWTWWNQAAGRYPERSSPQAGAVMVLNNYAGAERAHVAVVREIVSAREIRVDHANWLDDGAIYLNDPVVDISENNDWSQVRVFNIKAGGWGARVYPVQGFIGGGGDGHANPAPPRAPDPVADLLARADIQKFDR